MARAGYCHDCAAYVWIDDAWACPQGHPRERVNGWYDGDTGQPLKAPWAAQAPAPEAVASPAPASASAVTPAAPVASAAGPATRVDLLKAIVDAFASYPGYAVAYGTDTDIAISNKVADGSYGTGKKKVDFEAVMKAVEEERTLYYWEILKEKGAGISFGSVESESYSTFGAKRYGTKKEVLVGPGGVVAYEWDYAKTRQIVEATAAQAGWRVKTVLRKNAAQW